MSKEDNTYTIKSSEITHYSSTTFNSPKLKNGYVTINVDELEAIIRSGQYFSTIATKLDKLSHELKRVNQPQANQMQDLVDELLYIQARYKIKKKV